MRHITNKIVSYDCKLVGYDIDGKEYIIPLHEFVYADIDQAIYEWEQNSIAEGKNKDVVNDD